VKILNFKLKIPMSAIQNLEFRVKNLIYVST